MNNKKTSGSASQVEATATEKPTAVSVNEFQNRRARFTELNRKMSQFAKLSEDLEILKLAKVQGADFIEESEDQQVSKIVLQFDGAERYKNTYEIKFPSLMSEVVEHLKQRYAQRCKELETDILNFTI
jgi:hypothetical protein